MLGRNIRFAIALSLAVLANSATARSQDSQQAIGPFEVVSADSTSRLRLQFAGQQLVTWQKVEDKVADLTTELRRIRLALRGSYDRAATSFYVQLSFAARSLELMDFYVDHRIASGKQIRVGQFKAPFTRFRIQSFQRLTFPDWPIVTKYFGAERQIGVAIHNGYEAPPQWGYILGLFSGVNARASHGIGVPTAYGEEIVNPSDLAHPGPKSDVHPETFLHLSYHTRGMRIDSDSDAERGPARILTALSFAWDFDPTEKEDFTQRAAAEFLLKCNGWSANVVGYLGFCETGRGAEDELAMTGLLAQTAYRIDKKWELATRYAAVHLTTNLRYEPLFRYISFHSITQQLEATVGVNCYIDGQSLKWQSDISVINSTTVSESRNQYRVRSQLQLAF